jgi:hypothetical protein
MRADGKILTIVVSILIVFCAKPKSEWLKWQESLDLAYPNVLSFKIDMQKKNFFEGEPLVFKMLISNKVGIPQTIVHTGKRTSMIDGGLQKFKVVTELDSVLMYFTYVHANIGIRSIDAIILGAYDTLYCYAILHPDLFRQYDFPKEHRKLQSGEYILESNIHLGTKFYPKPGRALDITSHPTMFAIESLPIDEQDYLSKILPYMKNFFGPVEECLFPFDNNHEEFVDSALFWLDQIRNTNSIFAPYADFVYTCIPAVTRTYSDTIKINKSISNAKKFIEKYNGSILAEEMEFKLTRWLFLKDSTSTAFYKQAEKVIEKYPKNINSFGIRKHIPGGL